MNKELPDSLPDLDFEDLYLGSNFERIRTPSGVLAPLPEKFRVEAHELLEDCKATRKNRGRSEFSKRIGRHKFRVTAITDDLDNELFILSRSGGKPWDISRLSLPPRIISLIERPAVSGLVLAMGDMATGKTTVTSSIFAHRARTLGHYGITIEDPPEYDMNGQHENGWISQMPVHRERESLDELAAHAFRSRADMFMVSEIRDSHTAKTLMNFAPAGKLIFSTIHGDSAEDGLARLQSYCRASTDGSEESINGTLSRALTAIIMLRVHQATGPDGAVVKRRMVQGLTLDGEDGLAIRATIRDGHFSQLANYFQMQQEKAKWNAP